MIQECNFRTEAEIRKLELNELFQKTTWADLNKPQLIQVYQTMVSWI